MKINDIEASNDTIYEEHNDFNLCWPMAIVSCPISGKPDLYSSYDACLSLEEGKKAIKAWKEAKDSQVYFAYIQDGEGHIIYYENNIEKNTIGETDDTIYIENKDFLDLYWPKAIVSNPISGKLETAFTNVSYLTLEEAKKAIEAWKDVKDSLVYFAYVHDEEGHIIYYEVNITFLGDVNYDRGYKRYFSEEIKDSKKGNVLSLIKNKELH